MMNLNHILYPLLCVFVLLIMGCSTATKSIISKEHNAIQNDTIPFVLTNGNNILFKAKLNNIDTLDLYFDTGGTELILTHDAIKQRTSLLADGKNKSYQGQDYETLDGYGSLSLGNQNWDSLYIFPVTLGPENTDGHFGWNLFKNKIVELDYNNLLMIVHETLPSTVGYEKVQMEVKNTLLITETEVEANGKNYKNQYMFDSGFQRAVVMDKDLRKDEGFPEDLPVLKESVLRNSQGTKFVNKVVNVEKLCFENLCVNNVPVQLIALPNPAGFKTHILGNELLKRFNTIYDFKTMVVYLKPNQLINEPYADATKEKDKSN